MTWTETTLGAIAPFSYGKSLPQSERKSGTVPVYGSGGITGFHNEALIDGPACVIGRKGSVGRTYFANGPSWPIDTTFYTHGSNVIDLDYLYFLLQTLPLQESSDSAVPGLNRDYAHSLKVRIPDKFVQQRIANTLKSLDSKIRINSEISSTLETIAQTIFKSWFVDFDPVHAKSRGEQPEGMDAETAGLFPDSFEDSEQGPIPAGWHTGPVSKILTLQGGHSFKSKDWANSGVPVVKIGSVRPGFVDFTQGSFVSPELAARVPSKYELTRGSLVIGLSGYVGEVGLVEKLNVTPLLNQRVARFGLVNSDWKIPFAYCMTRDARFKDEVIASATGSAQANVSTSDILAIRRPIPPEHLVEHFDNLLEAHFQQILVLREQNAVLRELRDSLLPRLVSGELEIPEELMGE